MLKRAVFIWSMSAQILVFQALCAIAQVDTAWVRIYDGPAHGHDFGHAIAVDRHGNVYVTGASAQNPGGDYNFDIVTIKYDAMGNQLWLNRYNGPGDGDDSPAAIIVDTSGIVYVTGESEDKETRTDFVTIKYYDDGDTGWVRRYNGPENSWDEANSMVMDRSGHVYVTGKSKNSSDFDYVIIKYDASGNQLWVRSYAGFENQDDVPCAVALDNSGNVCVAGSSGPRDYRVSNDDFVTLKYDSSGNRFWVRRYNGPGDSDDRATDMAIDDFGNVYVTGYSHIYVTDYGVRLSRGYDYTTIKYDSNGNQLWVKTYNEPGHVSSTDIANAIAVDAYGNIHVTGESRDDITTIKYDPDGNECWVSRYEGRTLDEAHDIAVDVNGKVYVTGQHSGIGTRWDCVTVAYDSLGNQLWATRFNGARSALDAGVSIVAAYFGSVYVVGHANYSDQTSDFVTIRYVQTEHCK